MDHNKILSDITHICDLLVNSLNNDDNTTLNESITKISKLKSYIMDEIKKSKDNDNKISKIDYKKCAKLSGYHYNKLNNNECNLSDRSCICQLCKTDIEVYGKCKNGTFHKYKSDKNAKS